MSQIAHGSLTIVGANTENISVFWKGIKVPNLRSIRIEWEEGEQSVILKVAQIDPALEVELKASGIAVKKDRRHV